MPVEIRELHIQVNINESGGGSTSSNATMGSSQGGGSEADHNAIVELVVEKVLEILKEKMER